MPFTLVLIVLCLQVANVLSLGINSVRVTMPSINSKLQSTSTEIFDIDPNFESHLPTLLKRGLDERPDYDLASQLRSKYKVINLENKQKGTSSSSRPELTVEVRYFYYYEWSIVNLFTCIVGRIGC